MSRCQSNIQWVGVDWGTTNFRAYALDCNNELVDSIESDYGMDSIPRNGFEPALTQLIEPWLFEHRRNSLNGTDKGFNPRQASKCLYSARRLPKSPRRCNAW